MKPYCPITTHPVQQERSREYDQGFHPLVNIFEHIGHRMSLRIYKLRTTTPRLHHPQTYRTDVFVAITRSSLSTVTVPSILLLDHANFSLEQPKSPSS